MRMAIRQRKVRLLERRRLKGRQRMGQGLVATGFALVGGVFLSPRPAPRGSIRERRGRLAPAIATIRHEVGVARTCGA